VSQLDSVLTDLADRGLVGWDRSANRYDLHPIVRGVVWAGLGGREREAVYETLEIHFAAVSRADDNTATAQKVDETVELFSALVGLGRHIDAFQIYRNRLLNSSAYQELTPSPPYAYHWGLQRAGQLLQELGATPPEFDS